MGNIQSGGKRYYWVDNIKLVACILVVIGHFYMSMVTSNLCGETKIYNFIIQSVYTFHVPLFFVCSGFLYQKSDRVHSAKGWGQNILNKLLCLGVPYFTFTGITLLMKTVFSSEVNNQAGNALDTLFLHPTAPYWYLYALFFMFVFIPNVKNKKQAGILLAVAAAAKIFSVTAVVLDIALPYIIKSMCSRSIWFVLGMFLAMDILDLNSKISKIISAVFFVAAIGLSLIFYTYENTNEIIKTVVGLLFVLSILIMANNSENDWINKTSQKFSEYFMPVYVMHTIIAAGVRIVLVKLGVTNIIIHTVLGLTASFAIPVLVYIIAKRFKPLLFFFYPKKALKRSMQNEHQS